MEGFYTKLADVFVLEDTGTYTGSMLVQHMAGYVEKDVAVTTRDFFDLGIKLAYDFDVYKTLSYDSLKKIWLEVKKLVLKIIEDEK